MQRIGDIVRSPETQMLQPMHSRMSSSRPAAIFAGRNGSAIDGRAAPIMSRMPLRTWRTMVSGEVKRPTPTTGFADSCFRPATSGSRCASAANRDVAESSSQVPSTKSHRSGRWSSRVMISSASARVMPVSSASATVSRHATAARPAHSSRVSARISPSSRARFATEPP